MKQTRKTLGICCLIFCILLQCFLLQPVSVLAAPSASVGISSSTVKVGDTVTVTVTFSGGGTKMGAVDGKLTYDSSLLSFVGGDNANEASKGTVLMVAFTTSTSGSDAFTFSLTFQAQKAGSVTLRASTTEFGTMDDVVVENVSASKSMTVQAAATPTKAPTPTKTPTKAPTKAPSPTKTKTPTKAPTATKTPSPTKAPTPTETAAPTETPTETPIETPTEMPTITPDATTKVPTELPSETPSQAPENTDPADTTEPTVTEDMATSGPTAGNTATPKMDNRNNNASENNDEIIFSVQGAFLFCAIGMFLVGGTIGFILCYVVQSKKNRK